MESTLSVLPWNTCNAKCAHCGPDSRPQDKTSIEHSRVLDLIREAGERYSAPWCLSLSGGEIFLHYERLLEYCTLAKSLGGYTTLITNCFWARSEEVAEKMLKPLVDADLRVLGISFDKFHSPFISPDRVGNAISAAQKLRLRVHVRSVATKNSRLWQTLEQLADYNPWFTDFMEIPCSPAGRAILEIDAAEFIYLEQYPEGCCPAAGMTINPKGDAMICCNSAGELPGMNVGNVADSSLAELEENFSAWPVLRYLLTHGPAEALRLLPVQDRDDLEERKYVSVCHLCHDIFADTERRDAVFSAIRQHEWDHLRKGIVGIEGELSRLQDVV